MGDGGAAPTPVCIGVGGRAGIGRGALVDALAQRMAGRGPLTVGALPPCNDPAAGREPGSGGGTDGRAVPVDIAVHLVLHAPAPSDRRAMDRQRRRGVPVLMVRTRAGAGHGEAGGARGEGHEALTLRHVPGGALVGLDELVDCLSAGVGRILAARADAHRAQWARAALEGPERESAERHLRSAGARRMRAAGAGDWASAITSPESALREAARRRVVAAQASTPEERERAVEWVRRFTDLAVELGAPVQGAGDA